MAGFMAGFGTTLSNSIEADREYYREAASKRRDYLQTYGTKAVVDREDKANAAMGVVNELRTAGVDDNTLRFVLDKSGIQGVVRLNEKVASRPDLTKDDIEGLVKGAKDYVSDNPDASFSEVINRAYGLYKSTDKPVERQRNIFASMLGLDARMAEDEVLDDLYVNGYSGRDMYRIMGASGPKSGEALDLNLPAKPPSVAALTMANKELSARFEQSIDAELRTLTQQVSEKNDPQVAEQLTKEINALTALKGRGVQGYTEWANTDPRFWDYAKSLEVMVPGIITRNPSMVEFGQNYTTYWGDKDDDARIDSETPRDNKKTSSDNTTTSASVTNFDTAEEFNAAVESGNVLPGELVTIGGGPRQTLPPQPDTVLEGVGVNPRTATGPQPVPPEATKDLSTEANFDRDGDLSGYTDLYESIMARPEDERSDFLKTATNLSEQKNLADITVELAEATPALTDRAVGATAGGVVVAANWLNKGLAYAYNRLTGDSNTAAGMLTTSNLNIEKGKELIAEGIVATLQEQATLMELNGSFNQGRADKIKKALEDKRAIREELTESDVLNKAAEDMLLRIQDNDRQFLADDRNFPYVKPKVAQEKPTANEVSNREADALQARIQDNDRQFLADDRNFPNAPPFVGRPVDRPSEEPSKLSEFLSLVKTLATSTDEEKYKALGWNEPKGLMSSRRPKVKPLRLGQPEFMDLIKALHGSGSSVTATWEEKTSSPDAKLKVSDVTRLIKETKALPETKSRGKLLESLYDLRDVLNKRK